MNTTNWLVLIEENYNERETWCFYFPRTENNERSFELIRNILEDDIEEVASFSYGAIDNITAEQLLSLPNTTGYMNSHNVFEAELDIEKLKGIQEYENEFYKGGISDYIIAE